MSAATAVARDAIRNQLWPLPTVGIALAVVLGIAIPALDVTLDSRLAGWLDAIVFSGDADAARGVLGAVASSLITVTSLTFSLTVVTLQLASSQFSPRLLRTFTQDLFVQITLGVFLATFVFSLTVLRSVRSQAETGDAFVPRLAVTSSYLLAVASVVALVLFLAHLTRQIRVETMLARVRRDTLTSMRDTLRQADGEGRRSIPARPDSVSTVRADRMGFLTTIDTVRLKRAAEKMGAVISIDRQPGDFVVQGTPLATTWSANSPELTVEEVNGLRRAVHTAVRLGHERTAAQDPAFGLRQTIDIVDKALSPGVNDPTTAVHALGYVSSMLVELTSRELGPQVIADDEGQPRLILDRPDFERLLDLAIAQPRSLAGDNARVLGRIYELLSDLACQARTEHAASILDQLRRTDAALASGSFDDKERGDLRNLSEAVRADLASTSR